MSSDPKAIAEALRAYARSVRRSEKGQSDPWAKARRRSASEVDQIAELIESGDIAAIEKVGD